MNEKLEALCKCFEENRGKYIYSDTVINDFFEIYKNNYLINIKNITSNNINRIFLFIDENDALIYKGLIYESKNNLENEFDLIKNDLITLDLDGFISKYYNILK